MSDPDELARLQARTSDLEAQLAAVRASSTPPEGPRRRSRWWSATSAVALVLACVFAPLSVTAVWVNTQISDPDRFVETLSPLAADPAVQSAITEQVTRAVLEYVDVQGVTTDTLTALARQTNLPPRLATVLPGLAAPINSGVESFTRTQVQRFVTSPQFVEVWDRVTRAAHGQGVTLLEGKGGGVVSTQGDSITLNLGPIIAQVKDRLVASGFSLASRIPSIERSFVLVESSAISSAQAYYRITLGLASWLPLLTGALFALGVALARDRRRALLRGALGLVGSMVLLGLALVLGRLFYLDAVPTDVLPRTAADSVFETLVRFLRAEVRVVAVLGLVVALAAVMAGPSPVAVRTRRLLQHGLGSARGGGEAAGLRTGRFGTWTYRRKRALQATTLGAAALVLVFWTRPTTGVVVSLALIWLACLAVIELLSRPPATDGLPR